MSSLGQYWVKKKPLLYSVGQFVMNEGFGFVWKQGQLPFLIPPELPFRCKVDKSKYRTADRIGAEIVLETDEPADQEVLAQQARIAHLEAQSGSAKSHEESIAGCHTMEVRLPASRPHARQRITRHTAGLMLIQIGGAVIFSL